MATYNAIAEAALQGSPADYPEAWKRGGRVRVLYDKYTFSADLATTETISFGKLPKGACVIDAMIKHADLDGSGGTIDLGWDGGTNSLETADENALIEAADVASAANVVWASDNQASPAGIGHVLLDEVTVLVKTEGDTDATTGDIEVFVLYTID
jgi:hypothetical protein